MMDFWDIWPESWRKSKVGYVKSDGLIEGDEMPYIPEQHKKYHLLPMCQKNGGEVFEYPSALLAQLEEHGIHHLDPYRKI